MKKILLTDYIDYDFKLIGICSQEDDFKLCFALNKALELDFERVHDIELIHGKQKNQLNFSCFFFHDSEYECDYFLMSNRTASGYLLPEHKTIDYLLRIAGESDHIDASSILQKIKSMPQVLTAIAILPEETKSIENILV